MMKRNKDVRIIVAGELEIKGWHKIAKMVYSTDGICSCIHCQSNNLLQKIVVCDGDTAEHAAGREGRPVCVVQVGNLIDDTNIGFKNPQRGRVYGTDGIAPTMQDFSGGGGLVPKIVVYEDENKNSE